MMDEIDSLRADAERYRWLKTQKGLTLESDNMIWTRINGSKFMSPYRLCGNDIAYESCETLDKTIDTAMLVEKNKQAA